MGFVDNTDTDEILKTPDGSEIIFEDPDEEPEKPEEPEEPEESEEPEEAPASRGSVIVTVAAAIIGMVVGGIPAVLGAAVANEIPAILFLLIPVGICLFIALLGGRRDAVALVITVIFAALGLYITALMCRAAIYVKAAGDSFLTVPLVAATRMGEGALFGERYSLSATVFPVLFTVIGVAASWLTLWKTAKK